MTEEELIRQAMSALGRRRSPKKADAGTKNLAAGRHRLQDEDVREKIRLAQQARRERERAAREAAGAGPSMTNQALSGVAASLLGRTRA